MELNTKIVKLQKTIGEKNNRIGVLMENVFVDLTDGPQMMDANTTDPAQTVPNVEMVTDTAQMNTVATEAGNRKKQPAASLENAFVDLTDGPELMNANTSNATQGNETALNDDVVMDGCAEIMDTNAVEGAQTIGDNTKGDAGIAQATGILPNADVATDSAMNMHIDTTEGVRAPGIGSNVDAAISGSNKVICHPTSNSNPVHLNHNHEVLETDQLVGARFPFKAIENEREYIDGLRLKKINSEHFAIAEHR